MNCTRDAVHSTSGNRSHPGLRANPDVIEITALSEELRRLDRAPCSEPCSEPHAPAHPPGCPVGTRRPDDHPGADDVHNTPFCQSTEAGGALLNAAAP